MRTVKAMIRAVLRSGKPALDKIIVHFLCHTFNRLIGRSGEINDDNSPAHKRPSPARNDAAQILADMNDVDKQSVRQGAQKRKRR